MQESNSNTRRMKRRHVTAALCVAACVFVSGGKLGAVLTGRINVDATDEGTSSLHRDYANCLWYVARNHGFYSLQAAALDTTQGGDDAIWQAFVRTTGAEACNYPPDILPALRTALMATRNEADRYFIGQ